MLLRDIKNEINDGLRNLPYNAYLATMSILGDEVRVLYWSDIPNEVKRRVSESLTLVRDTASGKGPELAQVEELVRYWKNLLSEHQDDFAVGLLNALYTFQSLVGELANVEPRYGGIQRLSRAVVDKFRKPDPRGFRRVSSREEVDENSETARILRLFASVVAAAQIRAESGENVTLEDISGAATD